MYIRGRYPAARSVMGFLAALVWACGPTAHGQSGRSLQMFYGGGIGFSAGGDVQQYEISPLIGVHLNSQWSTGVSFLFRHRNDERFARDLSTDDYGATLFARYRVAPQLFLQAEYEYLNYEYYRGDLSKDSNELTSLLAGGGITQPLGRNSSYFATVLYNFSYDEANSPYADPWVLRFGVGIGF